MATMDLKAFCKKFKAYEKRVSARTAWSELLGEVGNATKNITTRAFENQKSPFNESWKPLRPATLRCKKGSLKFVESGHLVFLQNAQGLNRIKKELLAFNPEKPFRKDDRIDALASCVASESVSAPPLKDYSPKTNTRIYGGSMSWRI